MLELLYRHISLQGLMWLVLTLPLAGAALNGLVALATARDERARFKPLVTMLGCGLPRDFMPCLGGLGQRLKRQVLIPSCQGPWRSAALEKSRSAKPAIRRAKRP